MAGEGPVGHADTMLLRGTAMPSIGLAGMVADRVAIYRSTTSKGSAVASIATCRRKDRLLTALRRRTAM